MNIVTFQTDIIPGDPEANRQAMKERFEREVSAADTDLVVLPEMWTTAYTLPDLHRHAEEMESKTVELLQQLAVKNNVHIVGGSIAVLEEEKVYNRAIVIDRSGKLVYHYDKLHLVPMLNEPYYLAPGREKVKVFELDGVKMGLIICYDLRFPEIIRQLALEGAQALFIPAEWPDARAGHWEILQQARAIENQMYVISSNRIGSYDGVDFAGRSMITDPWGNILAKGSPDQEEFLHTSLDLENVKDVRRRVPIFDSRVPEFY
ncbi:carbon-nitrogen family hydrolase [Alteribacter natronophilus]|uniref:carbon-nitrogen family hydrolase n=1 Tax=Alteribacter natronophilus TaxID=2583810 RepID=UPI00110DA618|nr:carbon-nitrogen family hydrolase [Alteribacter natronophilus]TMW71008.1 carbon-nitrogen family hydrolase [Alteribacter natronophilus]